MTTRAGLALPRIVASAKHAGYKNGQSESTSMKTKIQMVLAYLSALTATLVITNPITSASSVTFHVLLARMRTRMSVIHAPRTTRIEYQAKVSAWKTALVGSMRRPKALHVRSVMIHVLIAKETLSSVQPVMQTVSSPSSLKMSASVSAPLVILQSMENAKSASLHVLLALV